MTGAAIETAGLTKSFGAHRGIEDVALEVRPGEILGFLGPNGAGKSTTIRILLGLYRASSGTARVLGLDPVRDGVEVRSRTGYLPGELSLFPLMTGRELVDRVARMRRSTETSFRDELIERFDVELDRPIHTLSKGNRQKLGIVVALSHRPELLVLDEPTSGLDPLLQNEFDRLLRETTAEGRTILLSSHDLDEVQRLADRVTIIKDGRIVVTDSIEGLRDRVERTMLLAFDRDVDPSEVSTVDGVRVTARGSRHLVLTFTGSVTPALRVATELEPVDLSAGGSDLDDLFLGYYGATQIEGWADGT